MLKFSVDTEMFGNSKNITSFSSDSFKIKSSFQKSSTQFPTRRSTAHNIGIAASGAGR